MVSFAQLRRRVPVRSICLSRSCRESTRGEEDGGRGGPLENKQGTGSKKRKEVVEPVQKREREEESDQGGKGKAALETNLCL
jgi:hypothetical protein